MASKIKARDLVELVELYNPFGFKDEKGRIMCFKTYEDIYVELMKRLHMAGSPLVDCVLFCRDTLGMSYNDAIKFCSLWRLPGAKTDLFVLVDWKDGGRERDEVLERIARGMHLLSETKFNKDMFLSALDKFKMYISANN